MLIGTAPGAFLMLQLATSEFLLAFFGATALVAFGAVAGIEFLAATRRKPTRRLCARCGWQWDEPEAPAAAGDAPLRPEECEHCRIAGTEVPIDVAALFKGIIGFGTAAITAALSWFANVWFGGFLALAMGIAALFPLFDFWAGARREHTRLRCGRCAREWDLSSRAA